MPYNVVFYDGIPIMYTTNRIDIYENFIEHNSEECYSHISYGAATELPDNYAFTVDDGKDVYEWWMPAFTDVNEIKSEYGNSAVLNFGNFCFEFFGRDNGGGAEDWHEFLKLNPNVYSVTQIKGNNNGDWEAIVSFNKHHLFTGVYPDLPEYLYYSDEPTYITAVVIGSLLSHH